MRISRQFYGQVERLVQRPSRGYTALSIQTAMFDGILISKLEDFALVYLHKAKLLVALESAFMLLLHGRMLACSVTNSCLTLCDPMDCSPLDSSVHGIHQARILKWVAIPFSRASSHPRDRTLVSHVAGTFFTI